MKMNMYKTDVQYIWNDTVGIDVSVDGETLKQAKDFVYLGGKICSNGTLYESVVR